MSKYTTEVRFICETSAGYSQSVGFNSIDDILTKSAPVIFNFDFPIFDENYRLVLEKKILRHYYTREIGEETVGLWKLRLNARLNDIMPYYNKLYESELIEFNPMYDVDVVTTHSRENNGNRDFTQNEETESSGTSETTGTRNDTNYDLYSETPQGAITNLENETYLTNARKKTNNESSEDNGSFSSSTNTSRTNNETSSNLEEYIERVTGKTAGASYSKILKEFRETFLNIDMMIIDDLSDLFFGLWE